LNRDEAAHRGLEREGQILDVRSAALRKVGASAAAPFQKDAGFSQKGIHVAAYVRRAGEDESGSAPARIA